MPVNRRPVCRRLCIEHRMPKQPSREFPVLEDTDAEVLKQVVLPDHVERAQQRARIRHQNRERIAFPRRPDPQHTPVTLVGIPQRLKDSVLIDRRDLAQHKRPLVAHPLPPEDIHRAAREYAGQQDHISPPLGRGHQGRRPGHDAREAVERRVELDARGAVPQHLGDPRRAPDVVERGALLLPGARPDVRRPGEVAHAEDGGQRVPDVPRQEVRRPVVGAVVVAVHGHERAQADDERRDPQEGVAADAVDELRAALARVHVEEAVDGAQHVGVVLVELALLLEVAPLLPQGPEVLVAEVAVVDAEVDHAERDGGTQGHQDQGVRRYGCFVPDVGGEVAGVGRLEEADGSQQAVSQLGLLGGLEPALAALDKVETFRRSGEGL